MDAANAYATPARALLPTCLAILAACGTASEHPARNTVVRDSAGITIVESSSPQWTPDRTWRVGAEPLVEIGGETDDVDYLFERIVGVVQLPGGRTAVADGGANQLRLYDSLGVLERVAGGAGRGPGEFRNLLRLFRYPDDSLVAYDTGNRRCSVFTSDLTYVRAFTLAGDVPLGSPIAVFSDGALLLRTYDMTEATLSIVGPYRQAEILYRYDPLLDSVVEIARPLGPEMLAIPAPGSGFGDRLPQPFGNESAAGAFADGFFTANSDTYEVRFFDRSQRLRRILRRLDYDDTVSNAEEQTVRAYFDSVFGPLQPPLSHGPFALRAIHDLEFSETRPAFGRFANSLSWPVILVDSQGDLWVLRYLAPGEETQHWDVFDAAGAWLGTVDFPERFTPIDIGARRIAGVWRDVDWVNHLRVYALEKAGAR